MAAAIVTAIIAPSAGAAPAGPAAATPTASATSSAPAPQSALVARSVTLIVGGRSRSVSTFAATVSELLRSEHVTVGRRDLVRPAPSASLQAVSAVRVVRVTVKTAVRSKVLRPATIVRHSASLAKGQRVLASRGHTGHYTVRLRITYHDRREVARRVVARKIVKPAPRVVLVGTNSWPVNTRLHWSALARCESSGNPRVVDSSGTYFGLYQFNIGTWHSVGGRGLPTQASAAEQTYRAQLLYNARGRSPWPVCGQYL